jgi:glycosyltransferase involved in cell wall biosynthesis
VKIILLSHDGTLYGAQRSLLELAVGLARRGHEVRLVVPEPGPLIGAAESAGVDNVLLPYPYPSTRPFRALRFLASYRNSATAVRIFVEGESPDAVLFNTSACLAPAAALRRSPVARVWHIREAVPQRRLLEGLIARWSNLVVFNSRDTADRHPRLRRLRESAIVYNGIDLQRPPEEETARVRREFGWEERDNTVVFSGQLRDFKDPMAVVDAVGILKKQGIVVKAAIAGDGPLMSDLVNAVSDLGLGENIRLTGYRHDVAAVMAAAGVLICPSLREPFGRTALEAMALGLPVIASSVGGLPEVVVHGRTGLLVRPGDRSGLAEAILELINNPAERIDFGKAGQERYRQVFTLERYVESMEREITRLIERDPPNSEFKG